MSNCQHDWPAEVTLSRRRFVVAAAAGAAALALPSSLARAALQRDSVVLQWNEALLEGVRRSRLGPPMVARALAVAHTCIEPGEVPASDLDLSWATFSAAADQAGISRRYGGIHFEQGDLDARSTGRSAARRVWDKANDYWEGS